MNITDSIYNLLISNTTLNAIVSGRVYPGYTPIKKAAPYITFDIVNDEPTDTKEGPSSLDVYYVQVSCFSKQSKEATNMNNYSRAALDRFSGADSGNVIDSIIYETSDGPFWDEESELFRTDCEFRVRVHVDFGSPGPYLMDVDIFVNGILTAQTQINPVLDNTINIAP